MIEILCTVSGVIAGSAVVASIMHYQAERNRGPFCEGLITTSEESTRLKGIADQLQILTHRVADDVIAHSEKVMHIHEQLRPADEEPSLILSAIGELIEANEAMQSQLAEAQDLLNQQSRQIEVTTTEARTDSLTGLANRRALDEYLQQTIKPPVDVKVSALLMLDIDHFKSCNDSYGHATGDAVLANFAHCLAQWCEGKCYAARYGGEEFAVVLTGASMDAISRDASLLRAYVSSKPIDYDAVTLTLTSSGGLTELVAGETIQDAYKRADEGLYLAKKEGRNCGYWLNQDQWLPFPSADELREQEVATLDSACTGMQLPAGLTENQVTSDMTLPAPESAANPSRDPHADELSSATIVKDPTEPAATVDVLELGQYLQRIEVHLAQLNRASLPGTAIMVHVFMPERLAKDDESQAWANALDVVQMHVRGIDVMCQFNQHTLCIFMPGSSTNAAIERAGLMQRELVQSRDCQKLSGPLPERFSIAMATAMRNETTGNFMQRLEIALEEALESQPTQVVIHDGTTCQLQSV